MKRAKALFLTRERRVDKIKKSRLDRFRNHIFSFTRLLRMRNSEFALFIFSVCSSSSFIFFKILRDYFFPWAVYEGTYIGFKRFFLSTHRILIFRSF